MAANPKIKRPWDWMELLLSGSLEMSQVPPAIQSWSSFFIHQGALFIAKMDDIEERRAALERIPASIRPYVQAELKRIWPLIRNASNP